MMKLITTSSVDYETRKRVVFHLHFEFVSFLFFKPYYYALLAALAHYSFFVHTFQLNPSSFTIIVISFPMSFCCSYCYAKDVPLQTCARCHKRKYCSRECQAKDWNSGQNHKYYCCKAGEFNLDFEIKPSPGRDGHVCST